ncbi:hypothetical protein QVG61_09215 [Thiohalobacter sp. IOR34]|uniref:hypothetical protein n=1 Tax=Thiohalobacter sp. IOR34 TaxID=3057176 RepID=UPI0025B057EB|nr:hypothetical protein [Thiohalobacter sp. IOR34]WJW74679.1 hypothetical protein QVG61_09215 [Thiohalobacter sp. IOR34]
MLNKAFNQRTEENFLIRLALIFALVFAAAHVAFHDLDMSGDGLGVQDECHVCRLNHAPAASLAVPSLVAPLQFLVYVLPIADSDYQLSHPSHISWARAPPLF